MTNDVFQNALDALGVGEPPRVWSFIVTIFGDLAQQAGDRLSGPVLGNILFPVGVRPEAMRVALHRLRNEGWIETTKQGRVGLHGLTRFGLEKSAIASETIYAPSNAAGSDWHVLCFAPVPSVTEQVRASTLTKQGYIAVSAGVYLANGPCVKTPSDALALNGSLGDVPVWLSHSIVSSAQRTAFRALTCDLERLGLDHFNVADFTPIQIATLRAQIVHRWRKLVLKLPDVPDVLYGADFEGRRCRVEVLHTLDVLQRPTIASLI